MAEPSKKRPRHDQTLLPKVTEVALHHAKISKEVGGMRVLGVRGHLRPPESQGPEGSDEKDGEALGLSASDAAVLASMLRSPHSIQIDQADFSELLEVRQELPRVLAEGDPKRPYRERKGQLKTVVHWGQRKLLLSEIEFLTLHGTDCNRVIYAGAAPGTHIPFLTSLFPHLEFVLVDPGEFRVQSSERPKIEVRREFFTAELAASLRQRADGAGGPRDSRTLFISDVRTGDPKIHSKEQVEAFVAKDMAMQQEWVRLLVPRRAMLKFRLPWAAGATEYLDGEVRLPVWGPPTTTEARLMTDGVSTKSYDNTGYEQQMFYFNNVTRVRRYRTAMIGNGLCESYDSAAELQILGGFVASLSESRRRTLEEVLGVEVDQSPSAVLDPLLEALFRRLSSESSARGAKGR
ncbi:unnamed protein product, partial [Polarella glacialis]